MKIGEFSKINKISIETVRHYMDLGLIIPYKNGSQYEFNQKCQKELENILNLKSLGFTLNEIKSIFVYETLGKLSITEKNNILHDLFTLKKKEISKKINELVEIETKLTKKIKDINSVEVKRNFSLGIDIKNLNLLSCVSCREDLYLEEGNIKNNQILDGKLKCTCGISYSVKSGILIVDEYAEKKSSEVNNNIIEEYIKETDENYILNVRKGLDWVHNELCKLDFSDKVILEIGSGLGFLLRNLYDDLDESSVYIAIDNNIEKHNYLKSLIERSNTKKNIMFICTDFKYVPIKEKSIDLFLDYGGSSNYWFEKNDFSIKDILKYLKEDSYVGLSYILFKKFVLSNSIKEENRKNFNINYIKEELKKHNFKMISEQKSDYLNKPSIYEDYFSESEEVYSYLYFGKR
ncbi:MULTISPECIES: MerR family transcriptional regulator [unclassified Clostridium]|uniref:MerR family transcriptional regulator n=2 Tax=Clostridium TaxID=1485 RepID=UPI00189A353B|nr:MULTISPECIES: MerR family transcriptional regulator [unclassified Clostridium]